MKDNAKPPIVCFIGRSNSGKTTLIEKLIPELSRSGLAVGSIKHDVHGFDVDIPGKDSWRHRQAGAKRTVISSPTQLALTRETDHDHGLDELEGFFDGMDLVIAEGYKSARRPKVEIFRQDLYGIPLCLDDPDLIAVVTEGPLEAGVPCFRPDEVAGLARHLKARFGFQDRPVG